MIQFENTITIRRDLEEVFKFVSDLQSIPKWNYYVKSVTPTSSQPGTAGATYHQVRESDQQNLQIVELQQDQSLVIETIPPSQPELRREMVFSREAGATRITDHWWLDLGVPRLLEPLAVSRVRKSVQENLGKLKTLLEEGRVKLQDGRSFSL